MQLIINPAYQNFHKFVSELPELFPQRGEMIHDGRNKVKIFPVEGTELVVKSFKIPHIINKIVYAFFRSSKAKRSYENGMKLLENGIGTPEPVGYIELFKNGFFNESYYVSLKSILNRNFREVSDLPQTSETNAILDAFARFTADLHQKNIYHKDYTPGNILFDRFDEGYRFELIDINRMKFCVVDLKMACKNFDGLYIEDDMFRFLAKRYAFYRNWNAKECEDTIMKYRKLRTKPI